MPQDPFGTLGLRWGSGTPSGAEGELNLVYSLDTVFIVNLDVQEAKPTAGPSGLHLAILQGRGISCGQSLRPVFLQSKGPQEQEVGVPEKKHISIYSTSCAWLALGPCWGDCVDTAEAAWPELRLEESSPGDDLSCLSCEHLGSGALSLGSEMQQILLGLQRTCCVHTGL